MASNTAQTQFRRALRLKNAGKDAKRQRNNYGTTPPFAVHTAEADAAAPDQVKKS